MSIQSIAMPTSLTSPSIATSSVGSPPASRTIASKDALSGNGIAPTSTPALANNAPGQKQQVEAAVNAVKEFIQPMAGNLEFQTDEDTGKTVIKIVDSSSGELIRQIPSEEMLEIAKALDRLQGLLVKQKA